MRCCRAGLSIHPGCSCPGACQPFPSRAEEKILYIYIYMHALYVYVCIYICSPNCQGKEKNHPICIRASRGGDASSLLQTCSQQQLSVPGKCLQEQNEFPFNSPSQTGASQQGHLRDALCWLCVPAPPHEPRGRKRAWVKMFYLHSHLFFHYPCGKMVVESISQQRRAAKAGAMLMVCVQRGHAEGWPCL